MNSLSVEIQKVVENELLNIPSSPLSDFESSEFITQIRDEFNLIYEALETQRNSLNVIMSNLKKYQNKVEKKLRKHKDKKTGITKPCGLSESLCIFLNVPCDTKMSRTDVTKRINKYIKEENLYDKHDRRKFIVNKVLSELLNIEQNESISFFSIQQKMNPHFFYADK